MYPLTLIRMSKGKKIEVELKNNEIYEGILKGCDLLMNMCLKNVNVKTRENSSFFLAECYIKGSVIKHVKLSKKVFEIQKNLESRENKIVMSYFGFIFSSHIYKYILRPQIFPLLFFHH